MTVKPQPGIYFFLFFVFCTVLLFSCAPQSQGPISQAPIVHPLDDTGLMEPDIVEPPSREDVLESDLERAASLTAEGCLFEAFELYNRIYHDADTFHRDALMETIQNFVNGLDSMALERALNYEGLVLPRPMLVFRLALNATVQGDYPKAEDLFQQYIETWPENDEVDEAADLLAFVREHLFRPDTLGCLLPLSGRFSKFGRMALSGIEMAVAELSRETGREITVIVKDTRSDDSHVQQCIDELDREKVAAIAGPIVTAETAARIAQERQIPMVALTQKNQVAAEGPWVFSNFLTPEMQAHELVSYAFSQLGVTRFAILYPDDRYGRTYMNLFWDNVQAFGGEVVGVESYSHDQTDFSSHINKLTGLYYPVPGFLKEQKALERKALLEKARSFLNYRPDDMAYPAPRDVGHSYINDLQDEPGLNSVGEFTPELLTPVRDERIAGMIQDVEDETDKPMVDFRAIFIPDAPDKVSLILPQLAYHDVNDIYLLGTNIWHDSLLLKNAKGYIRNAVITEGYFALSRNERASGFAMNFTPLYGYEPGLVEASAHDTIKILAAIINDPAIRSRRQVMEELSSGREFDCVTGKIRFDATGNAQRNLFFLTVQKNKFVEIIR